MATTQQPSFAPVASAQMSVSTQSVQVPIPGTGSPAMLRIKNGGIVSVFVLMGTSASVVVTPATGMQIGPGETAWLTIGSETNIAAITQVGNAQLNLTAGN